MPRHYVNPAAMCPFYLGEETTEIYCSGVEEGTVSIQRWKTSARDYKKKFCYADWKNCPISMMLQKKFE